MTHGDDLWINVVVWTFEQYLLIPLIGLATATATLFGGLLALRYRTAHVFLLGFSGGAVVGVSLFDLLPEAFEAGGTVLGAPGIIGLTTAGFLLYVVVDRVTARLAHSPGAQRGHLAAASLTVHSLVDGLGVGLAFQLSPTVGSVVAVGVLAHDILDGANTVAVNLRDGGSDRSARLWLLADAVAPLLGIVAASQISISAAVLAALMAMFGGVFLHIGLCDLLARAYAHGLTIRNLGSTTLGLIFIYTAVRLAG